MARVAIFLSLAAAACSATGGPPAQPLLELEATLSSISIYRDGDPRFDLEAQTISLRDGSTPVLAAVSVGPPVALVVERSRLRLSEGSQDVALSRVPIQASSSSIWVESLGGDVVLESVSPSRAGPTALMGRRVRADVGGAVVIGDVVAIDSAFVTIRAEDGKLWLIASDRTSLAADASVRQSPVVKLRVARAGTYDIEVGYTTAALDWSYEYRLELGGDLGVADAPVSLEGRALLTVGNQTDSDFKEADVSIFSGTLSSSDRHPIAVWRGPLSVESGRSVSIPLAPPPLRATVGYEFRPVDRLESGDRAVPAWGQSMTSEVSKVLWLEPDSGGTLVAGKVVVRAGDQLFESVLRERVTGPKLASVRLASAPELIGRRTQRATRRSRDGETFTESVEVEIENRGAEPRSVLLVERLLRSSRFELVKSEPAATQSGDELHVTLEVAAKRKKTLRYTVRYSI